MASAWSRFKKLASKVNQLGQPPKPGAHHPDAWMWRYAKAPLDSNVTRLMSLAGVLNEDNGMPVNIVDPRKPKATAQAWLGEWWGVGSATEARHQLDSLIDEGHGPVLDEAHRLAFERQPHAIETLGRYFPQWPAGDLEEFYGYVPGARTALAELSFMAIDAPPITTKAYDIGRCITVARMCAAAGYLQDDDVLHVAHRAGRVAMELFSGWPEYALSYVLGRGIWGGDSELLRSQIEIARMYLEHDASPWLTAGWLRPDEL